MSLSNTDLAEQRRHMKTGKFLPRKKDGVRRQIEKNRLHPGICELKDSLPPKHHLELLTDHDHTFPRHPTKSCKFFGEVLPVNLFPVRKAFVALAFALSIGRINGKEGF